MRVVYYRRYKDIRNGGPKLKVFRCFLHFIYSGDLFLGSGRFIALSTIETPKNPRRYILFYIFHHHGWFRSSYIHSWILTIVCLHSLAFVYDARSNLRIFIDIPNDDRAMGWWCVAGLIWSSVGYKKPPQILIIASAGHNNQPRFSAFN